MTPWKIRAWLVVAIMLVVAAMGACEEDVEGDPCPGEGNLVRVSAETNLASCESLVSIFELRDLFARPDLTYYEAIGTLFVDFDTPLWVRLAGTEDEPCMKPIYGKSPFTLRGRLPDCRETVHIEILDTADPQGAALCAIRLDVLGECKE